MRVISKNDGGGTTQLTDWAFSWIFSGFRSKLYILLDKDPAGIKAKQEIENSDIYKEKQNSVSMRIQYLQPSDEIIGLHKKHIDIYYEIEHLLSHDFWRKIIGSGLATLRSDQEIYSVFSSHMKRDKTLDETISDLVDDPNTRETILSYEPKSLKKKQILELLDDKSDASSITNGLKRTLERLESYFC